MNNAFISAWVGLFALLLLLPRSTPATASPSDGNNPGGTPPTFTAAAGGELAFDTGLLRGRLRSGGKSTGLAAVIHVPFGKRLDRSNGLLSHYRVFTKGMRYGGGAWDWPSRAALRADGAVEVDWPSTENRPFHLRAVYRWRTADTLDLETAVKAENDLIGFESFLASYFSEGFTNAAVFVARSLESDGRPGFLRVGSAAGAWQMFPRDDAVLPLIQDGRWHLEPNPVNWTLRPRLGQPLGFRRDPATGLTAVLMSPPADCFALASPEETERHDSLYLSLFGHDLKAGHTAVATTRLVIRAGPSDEQLLQMYQSFAQQLRSPTP